eukprot:1937882-Pyramimonas_sp.AAC.1
MASVARNRGACIVLLHYIVPIIQLPSLARWMWSAMSFTVAQQPPPRRNCECPCSSPTGHAPQRRYLLLIRAIQWGEDVVTLLACSTIMQYSLFLQQLSAT